MLKKSIWYKLILVVMILCLPLLVSSPKIIPASAAENEDNISITVLNYHKIDDMNIALSVLPSDFDRQMAYLKEHGYNTINSQQLYEYLANGTPLPSNPIMITFDDGYEDNYRNAYPILQKYGFTGTIFVITDFVSAQPNYLTWEQIKEMKAHGMDFQSHTATHQSMTGLSEEQLRQELTKSKQTLECSVKGDQDDEAKKLQDDMYKIKVELDTYKRMYEIAVSKLATARIEGKQKR